MSLRLKSLEAEYSTLNSARSQLELEIELKVSTLTEKQREIEQLNIQISKMSVLHERAIQELKENEAKLQKSLVEAKEKEENMMKELAVQQDKERKYQEEKIQQTYSNNLRAAPAKSEILKSYQLQHSSATNLALPPLEKMQTLLKQKEGEIAALQQQIMTLEKTRDQIQDELVNLTAKNESLLTEVTELKGLRSEIKALQQRYDTLLELMGEKEEQVEELKADITDMKSLYKVQISELLEQIEHLKSGEKDVL